MAKAIEQQQRPIKLFYLDEGRFGLIQHQGRKLCLKGIKPIARVQHRYANTYYCSAVAPLSGDCFAMELTGCDSQTFALFLQTLAAKYHEFDLVIVLDNAGWHTSQATQQLVYQQLSGIHLCYLPPYSPELNPVERIWQEAKRKLKNQLFKSLEEVVKQVDSFFHSAPNAFWKSLTCFPYINDVWNQVNPFL